MYNPTLKEFIKLSKKGNVIPVYREISADFETPVSAFVKIDEGNYSYLLESIEGGENIGRYSFLGANPSLIFRSKDNRIEIIEKNSKGKIKKQKYLTDKDPLYEIKELMNRYKFVEIKGLPRFCGGLVGYMSYDMVRFFEQLPKNTKDDIGAYDSFFVLTDTILIFDRIEHKIKIVSNAYVKKGTKPVNAYKYALSKIDKIITKLNKAIPKHKTKINRRKIKIKSNLTKKRFEQMVKSAKRYIRKGDIIQTVLSQRFEVDITTPHFDIYRALRSVNPSPYMFYLKYKDMALVGSSPEMMVRLEGNKAQVRPIAGTRPRGKDEIEDKKLEQQLLNDAKERAEHIMLVDLGRNDLGRVSKYGSVNVSELMTIERYSHVMHIVSNCVGNIKRNKDQYDLIRAAFPAGTVSGAPKIRAMEIIEELEQTKRGIYAGTVGYIDFSGNVDTCITIRTILAKKDKAYVQAGAGIVADSVPEKEYKETVNKAKGMIKAIELAEKGI